MRHLLEHQFTEVYDNSGKAHSADLRVIAGDVTFRDSKACDVCIPFFYKGCGHQTFLIHTDSTVNAIDIERFLNTFKSLPGDRCDYLFYDDHKCVLMDLYCGMSEFLDPHRRDSEIVRGKKEKVRSQITKTIERLYSVPALASRLDGMHIKEGVFGYRSKDDGLFAKVPKTVATSFDAFLLMSRAQANRRLAAPMVHGFRFLTCQYPNIYQW